MTTDEMLADGLMTIPEAAEFLAVNRSTVYVAMDGGRLPYVKIGRARRIPRRALVEFVATNTRGGWNTTAAPDTRSSVPLQPIGQ